MIEAILGVIKDEMNIIDVPYAFMRWTSSTTPERYWIGEYTQTTTETEDGYEEYNILLTGTTKNSWREMLQDVAKIKEHFSPIGGLPKRTDKGVVVVYYDNSFPVPTGEADLKRIQVNLRIKAWKGNN